MLRFCLLLFVALVASACARPKNDPMIMGGIRTVGLIAAPPEEVRTVRSGLVLGERFKSYPPEMFGIAEALTAAYAETLSPYYKVVVVPYVPNKIGRSINDSLQFLGSRAPELLRPSIEQAGAKVDAYLYVSPYIFPTPESRSNEVADGCSVLPISEAPFVADSGDVVVYCVAHIWLLDGTGQKVLEEKVLTVTKEQDFGAPKKIWPFKRIEGFGWTGTELSADQIVKARQGFADMLRETAPRSFREGGIIP